MNKILYITSLIFLCISCTENINNPKSVNSTPLIKPDYIGVTIPINIAPLNIMPYDDNAEKIDVIVSSHDNQITLHSQSNQATSFDIEQWHNLLAHSVGNCIKYSVCIKKDGQWTKYSDFNITISPDSIDYGLAYRLIAPGYQTYGYIGIFQTNLSTGEQTPIIENTQIEHHCINCHSFSNYKTNRMSIHVRGPHGCTAIVKDNKIDVYNTRTDTTKGNCVYPSWHPNGRHIAYSVNKTHQMFHYLDPKRVEVFDDNSDIVVFDTENNTLVSSPLIFSKDADETFPYFSPDGKYIYYCTTIHQKADVLNDNLKNVKYDLCRIGYDATTNSFGDKVDTLIHVSDKGKSVAFPRPSPDGKFLAYTLADYGTFPIWHPEADIWILNLNDSTTHRLDGINSNDVDSYHSWSSNGKWMVVSSRRENGLFTQPFIAHIDDSGYASKAFRLPLESPIVFDEMFLSFNIPEFITEPVRLSREQFESKVNNNILHNINFLTD